jgi:hypothetical protein
MPYHSGAPTLGSQQAKIPAKILARAPSPYSHIPAALAVFLSKAAKHLALLACLLIVGKATGRLTTGQFAIFCLTIFASVAHLAGRALAPRLPDRPFKTPP